MLLVIVTLLLIVLVYLPRLWVKHVMRRYSQPDESIPGTGGELAQHLITRFELNDVGVEETPDRGDHYDPHNAMVRLSPDNFHGRSLTAIAVAAHEVGHAIQFYRKEPISRLRQRYLPLAYFLKNTGVWLIYLMPVVGIVVRSPAAVGGVLAISLVLQLLGALAYLIILPEEWDASFNKAMPILIEGGYIREQDQEAANQILKAAAMTYFAGALADLVNVARWLVILRR